MQVSIRDGWLDFDYLPGLDQSCRKFALTGWLIFWSLDLSSEKRGDEVPYWIIL